VHDDETQPRSQAQADSLPGFDYSGLACPGLARVLDFVLALILRILIFVVDNLETPMVL